MTYPLAKDGVFRTIRGEGHLSGVPMNFVRLAGCSVGCPECDTDYRVIERVTAGEIGRRVDALPRCEWSFVTGGEPADHDLAELLSVLNVRGAVMVVTSGSKPIALRNIHFLSVSPHTTPDRLVVQSGSQVNIVPGLNGLNLNDWQGWSGEGFNHRYVTPLHGDARSLSDCLDWLETRRDWRLGIQAHKVWGIA